jgi:murein DD-endopeptidase MepM/ murein hydrolase activator NlpD
MGELEQQPDHGIAATNALMTRRQLRELEQGPGRVELARARRGEPRRAIRSVRSAKRGKTATRASHAGSSRPRKSFRKRIASKLLSLGAGVAAVTLMIGMSVPANAFKTDSPVDSGAAVAKSVPVQTFQVSATALGDTAARDSFGVTSYAQMLVAKYGNRSYDYATTTGAVRWPFPYPVPISSGFGSREAPCYGCSSEHNGIDFTPGNGVPIYAIADGFVATSEDSNYGYGNSVVISHVINGQNVQSLYAHMQHGTSTMTPGMVVKVGDLVGLVGDTGTSVGAHLHFEIILDGIQVDPFPWLQANAVN